MGYVRLWKWMVRMPGFPARPGRTNRGSRALQVLGGRACQYANGREPLYEPQIPYFVRGDSFLFFSASCKAGLICNDLPARLKSCPDENRRCHTNSESPSRRGFRSLGSPGSLLKRGLLRETRPIYGPGSDTMFICAKHSVNNTQIQSAGVLSANLDAAFEAILCH